MVVLPCGRDPNYVLQLGKEGVRKLGITRVLFFRPETPDFSPDQTSNHSISLGLIQTVVVPPPG